jgi:hypothetical protein
VLDEHERRQPPRDAPRDRVRDAAIEARDCLRERHTGHASAADLDASLTDLERRGWVPERRFEIPQGPCATFRTPTGHRMAVYQPTRPQVGADLERQRDF